MTRPSSTPPRFRQAVATGLLILGALAWVSLGSGRGIGGARWTIILGTGAAGWCFPRALFWLERLRRSPRRRAVAPILIGLLAAVYFVTTAVLQDRDLFPKTHDDSSYLLGMQMLARGRLWMPPLPLPDFFESFYVLVKPVYCSMYFPGTALLFVPTLWLHLPLWLMPALAAGGVVALVYLVTSELMDDPSAALAALLMVSLSWFRMLSVLLTSHVPMLLFGLAAIWTWLRWRKSQRPALAAAMGALIGWAAITRPADSLAFAVPLAVATAFDLAGQPARRWAVTLLAGLAAMLPFLAIQAAFDAGVTGSPFETPFGLYARQDQPGVSFGFHAFDPAARPASSLPQKQAYFIWVQPYVQSHQPGSIVRLWSQHWLPMVVDTTLPCRIFLLFLPVGLLGMTGSRRRVLAATLPLFVIIYVFYPFFLEHYAVIVAPAVILLCLLGGRVLAESWPRRQKSISAAFVGLVLAAAVTNLWEVNHFISPPAMAVLDETFPSPLLRVIHEQIPAAVQKPAVVLFTFPPGASWVEEPVYNTDTAWPDDADIIRAHDLGPDRDREIFSYYAARQPRRMFYRFERRTDGANTLRPLGTAGELAAGPGK